MGTTGRGQIGQQVWVREGGGKWVRAEENDGLSGERRKLVGRG